MFKRIPMKTKILVVKVASTILILAFIVLAIACVIGASTHFNYLSYLIVLVPAIVIVFFLAKDTVERMKNSPETYENPVDNLGEIRSTKKTKQDSKDGEEIEDLMVVDDSENKSGERKRKKIV